MLLGDEYKFIWLGALFAFLGIVGILWGLFEDRFYENALSHRFDLREFIERLPKWPEPGSLKIGGMISLAVGVVLLAIGLAIYYRG